MICTIVRSLFSSYYLLLANRRRLGLLTLHKSHTSVTICKYCITLKCNLHLFTAFVAFVKVEFY